MGEISRATLTAQPAEATEFTDFVLARGEKLLDLAWLITRNAEDAQDATQEALAGLYARWAKLPAGDELDAYVHRTLVNACLRVIRRRPRSFAVADPDALRSAPVTTDGAEALAASDEVWRLCGGLSPVQRTAVALRFFEDLSFAEIGKVLGCREATARSHIHRAVTHLRARREVGEQP